MSIRKLASGVALAALMTSPALAADLDRSYKDVPADYAQSAGMVNWTGFYIGGAVGYGNSSHNLSVEQYNGAYCFDQNGSENVVGTGDRDTTSYYDVTSGAHIDNVPESGNCDAASLNGTQTGSNNVPHGTGTGPGQSGWTEADHVAVAPGSREVAHLDGVNASGFVGDVRLGYDRAVGRYLFGVYGTYGFSNMEADAGIDGIGVASIEKQDEWFIGVRAGYLVAPRTLAYILAGYSQTEYDFSVSDGTDSATKSVTFDGVTVGGGLEFALAGNLFLGLEATHTFYGEETIADTGASEVGGFGSRLKDDLDETKVMLTAKIKLNGLGD